MSGDPRVKLDQQHLTARLYREHGRPFAAGAAAGSAGAAVGPLQPPAPLSAASALPSGAGPRGQRAAMAQARTQTPKGLFHDPRAAQQQQAAAAAAAAAAANAPVPAPRSSSKGRSKHKVHEEKESNAAAPAGYNTASTLAAPLLSPTGTPLPAPGTFLVSDARRARSVQPKEDPSMVEVPEALKGLLGEKSVAFLHSQRGAHSVSFVDCLLTVVSLCRCQALSPHPR